eukprot:111758-Chlamydomonas_euryale.AAC.13
MDSANTALWPSARTNVRCRTRGFDAARRDVESYPSVALVTVLVLVLLLLVHGRPWTGVGSITGESAASARASHSTHRRRSARRSSHHDELWSARVTDSGRLEASREVCTSATAAVRMRMAVRGRGAVVGRQLTPTHSASLGDPPAYYSRRGSSGGLVAHARRPQGSVRAARVRLDAVVEMKQRDWRSFQNQDTDCRAPISASPLHECKRASSVVAALSCRSTEPSAGRQACTCRGPAFNEIMRPAMASMSLSKPRARLFFTSSASAPEPLLGQRLNQSWASP